MSLFQAIILGIVQGLTEFIPVGQTKETAARFSFLLSIPAIATSGLLELKEAVVKLPADSLLPVIVAVIVSGIVGYLSIWFLLSFLKKRSLGIFIAYRLIIGVLIITMLSFGFISAQ
jgi:undecaprenyl-diphosphatase